MTDANDHSSQPIDDISCAPLFPALAQVMQPQAADWLATANDLIASAENAEQAQHHLLNAIGAAKRKAGHEAVIELDIFGTWHSDEIARLSLLTTLKQAVAIAQWPSILFDIFRQGDESEKMLIARTLHWLGENCDVKAIALDAARSNSIDVFSAIALNNPYPGRAYDDDTFNRMVLKALFMDLSIVQICQLEQRVTPTLSQLAIDLVNERLVAGREAPYSIWLAMRFDDLNENDRKTFIDHVNNHGKANNLYTIQSLKQHPVESSELLKTLMAEIIVAFNNITHHDYDLLAQLTCDLEQLIADIKKH